MKPFLSLLLLLVLAPAGSRGTPIAVGGTSIELPNPPGFVGVTPQMTKAYDLGQQLVPPTNVQFATFIPEAEAAKALKGELPDFTRRLAVQTVKAIESRAASTADFAQLKTMVRTQNDETIKKMQAKFPALMNDLSQNLSKHYDTKLALSLSQMVPFPAHEETARTLAYSMLVKYDLSTGSGQAAQDTSAGTVTFIHAKDKIIFLYCFAEEAGLDWTKETSKQWASAILAANPHGLAPSVDAPLAQAAHTFDWRGLATWTVVGAMIGGVVGLLNKFLRKKRSRIG